MRTLGSDRIKTGRVSRNEAAGRNKSARRLRRRGPGRGDNVRRSHASASGWLRNETRRLSLMQVFRVNSGTVSRSAADGLRPKLQGFGRRGGLRRTRAQCGEFGLLINVFERLGDARRRLADRKPAQIAIVKKTTNAATSKIALAADKINRSRLHRT